jgi:hypothetical protein
VWAGCGLHGRHALLLPCPTSTPAPRFSPSSAAAAPPPATLARTPTSRGRGRPAARGRVRRGGCSHGASGACVARAWYVPCPARPCCSPPLRFSPTTRPTFRFPLSRADAEENPYRYVLSLALPAPPSAPTRTLHLGGGRLAYQLEDGSSLLPPPAPPIVEAAQAPTPAVTQAPPAKEAASKPPGRTSVSVAASTPAAAIPAAAAPAPATAVVASVAHSQCRWAIDWRDNTSPTSFFIGRATVAALTQRLGAGGSLPVTLRRVLVESVEEDDPVDAVFSLEAGKRLLEEDHAVRGGAVLALQVRCMWST